MFGSKEFRGTGGLGGTKSRLDNISRGSENSTGNEGDDQGRSFTEKINRHMYLLRRNLFTNETNV